MQLRRYPFIETPRGGILLFCQVVTAIFIKWYNLCLDFDDGSASKFKHKFYSGYVTIEKQSVNL